MIGRVEVLDRVKNLFLIPDMEVMTAKMVADYYEIDESVIQKCYQRNKLEIDQDGVIRKTVVEMKDFWNGHCVQVKNVVGGAEVIYKDVVIKLPNSGLRLFSKRAALRFGMLLRDSVIAKEIRTQLLNIFEHSTKEQRTMSIDEETALFTEMGRAYATGDKEDIQMANRKYIGFKNRHIAKLESENSKLSNINKDLEATNKILSRATMTWGDKAILNALMRSLATNCFHGKFDRAWSSLYRQILYKLSINVHARTGSEKLIDRIKDSEMKDVIAVAASLCKSNNLNVGKIINEINGKAL